MRLRAGLTVCALSIAICGAITATAALGGGTKWRWSFPAGVAAPDVPADNPMSRAKVELGRRLFYDADLSVDGTMSCATCHEQKRGFADGNATRAGVHGEPGRRNVPGLVNVAWLPRLTWADPHLTRLEDQVVVPVLGTNPVEMGMKGKEAEIGRRLGGDACYRRMFSAAFPERGGTIDLATVSAALAAFQRTMIAFDSPFDAYRRGKTSALSSAARRGAMSFFGAGGCASCHAGPDLTDAAYHRVSPGGSDKGLREKTGRPEDEGRFRTPSLRNVAITGPWLHDGSAVTLSDALRRHPAPPSADQLSDLLLFLESLTDQRFLTDERLAMPDHACGRRL